MENTLDVVCEIQEPATQMVTTVVKKPWSLKKKIGIAVGAGLGLLIGAIMLGKKPEDQIDNEEIDSEMEEDLDGEEPKE